MQRQLVIADKTLTYFWRTYRRSRSIRLSVHPDGRITISSPARVSLQTIESFIRSKAAWLLPRLDTPHRAAPRHSPAEITRLRLQAREIVESRLAHFNTHYQHTYRRVTIRNQRTRWGSCSKTGTLNFNYRIALLPPHLVDYIVVHELCHLREFNHSPKFWALVAACIPECKTARKELRAVGLLG